MDQQRPQTYSPPIAQNTQFQIQPMQQPQQIQAMQPIQSIPQMQQILQNTSLKKRKYHQLTEYEKAKINYLKGSGKNITEIANELGISRTSINYYIKRISNPNCKYGKTGRPRKPKTEAEKEKELNKNNFLPTNPQMNIPQQPQAIIQTNFIPQQSNLNIYPPSNSIRLNAINDGNSFTDQQVQPHDYAWKPPSQPIFKQSTGYRQLYDT
ncbi:hypothetical protein M9Y10_022051 [Tritrichomonas musculus]|uniref:Tc3 transposase DNA binding domain-containing protein n=1 Tax=Tritrichomonas musculus TaxID=1915356 RepID=A0ABR2KS33_9EUKA